MHRFKCPDASPKLKDRGYTTLIIDWVNGKSSSNIVANWLHQLKTINTMVVTGEHARDELKEQILVTLETRLATTKLIWGQHNITVWSIPNIIVISGGRIEVM